MNIYVFHVADDGVENDVADDVEGYDEVDLIDLDMVDCYVK